MNVEEIIKTKKDIPLKSRTLIHLTLVQNKIIETMSAALKPYDVSIQQFNVLRILRGQQGKPANLSTLNERMVTKMSNTTRLVDKLLAKGFVKRNICKENRRKVEIYITPTGEETLMQIDKTVSKVEEVITNNFNNEELKKLNHLLNKF